VGSFDANCDAFTDDAPLTFSVYALLGQLGVWLTIYFCVFKGTKISGYIVWVTVPLPVIFVLCMIINGSQLDGASEGVTSYFHGNGEDTTFGAQWSDAAG
jgi:solute carrier family 6 (neurotransmitter transporter, GABA) member 11